MIFKWLRLVILLLVSGIVYYSFQVGIPFLETPLPAFGKLINPSTGFWKNNEKQDQISDEVFAEKINAEVNVYWDERRVPHVFAKNNYDLYFTQGFITAKDRLWQMDFVSRVSSGRLAEVVGTKATNFDQFHRRIGLPRAAKMSIDTLQSYPAELEALEAYADGVNAYIETLKPEDYPIEFKLLNYKPEKWSPYKSVLILKYMAWDLDGSPSDKYLTQARNALPPAIFERGFPTDRPYSTPIISTSSRTKRSKRNQSEASYIPINQELYQEIEYRKGSNNWVVNGSKTKSGNPILANDPHLSLALPALWYENQLVSDDCNVYGVSLPGIPMVVIGFNSDVAWGLTYTTSDCIDFVQLEMNNEGNQYKLDGQWENPLVTEDTIKVRGHSNRINKTMITKFGPIVYTDSIPNEAYNHNIPAENVAMNWTANAPTLELLTMYRLNRAKNLADYQAALPYFSAPGQNFIFASKENDIAIWHNGKFPIRNSDQARFVNPEASSDLLWKNYIPFQKLPHQINPSKGYLFSANQQPVDDTYPYYLGSDDYANFERANRIEEVLDTLNQIVPQDFQKLQTDNQSMLGKTLLPFLLSKLDISELEPNEKDVYLELQNWDYEFSVSSKAPGFFYDWVRNIRKSIWADERIEEQKDSNFWLPFSDVTTELLLTDSLSVLYDNQQTEIIETQRDILFTSFQKTVIDFTDKYGSLNEKWQWGTMNPTQINSLANMDGFGYGKIINTGGASNSVNAINGNYGPSWRMIVALDDVQPIAYGIYPGGQSGNPGSQDYSSFVDTWGKGGYYQLHLIQNEENITIPVKEMKLTPTK